MEDTEERLQGTELSWLSVPQWEELLSMTPDRMGGHLVGCPRGYESDSDLMSESLGSIDGEQDLLDALALEEEAHEWVFDE